MTAPPDNSRTLAGYNLSLSDPTRVCRVNSDTGRSRDRALGAPPHRPPRDVSRLPMEKSSAARDQLIPAALPNTALRKLATGACLSLADRGIASRTRARFASQEELGELPFCIWMRKWNVSGMGVFFQLGWGRFIPRARQKSTAGLGQVRNVRHILG